MVNRLLFVFSLTHILTVNDNALLFIPSSKYMNRLMNNIYKLTFSRHNDSLFKFIDVYIILFIFQVNVLYEPLLEIYLF